TLAARYRRSDALIFLPELPPGLVVLFRRNLAGEYFPAPLVDQQPEGQERDFFEGSLEKQSHVLGRIGRGLEQSDPDQVFRRHRQRDRIADSLMKAVIGAVAEQIGLMFVG